MTTTLRVHEPREIISLVPYRLGFRPRESAVAVSLRAPRGRVGVVMRVDLADLGDRVAGPQVARAAVGALGRDRAVSTLLVVYTAQDPRGHADAVARAVQHYRDACEVSLGAVPVWVVTSTGYLSYDCDRECCPPGGRPVRELESTQVAASMVLDGATVAASREDVARIDRVGPERRRVVARSRRRWEQRGCAALQEGTRAAEQWRLGSLEAWRGAVEAMTRGTPAGARVSWGRIEAGLADRRVRDAVLTTFVDDVGDLPERSLVGERVTRDVDELMGRVSARIMGPAGVRPPRAGAARAAELALEGVVAHGRRDRQAPALTLLATLAWWRGEGARAGILLDRAMRDEPGYRLAELLAAALAAGLGPGWTRATREADDV